MSIYIVRHGQTDWNIKGFYQGHIDIPLNSTGKEQAIELHNKIQHINFDIAISSPLKRALDTANIALEGRNIPIQIENRLIERSFGDLEGKNNSANLDCSNDILLDYNLNYTGYNVEPIHSLFSRIFKLMDEITEKYKDKDVLLITHNAVSIAVDCYFNGIPTDKKLITLGLNNCAYKKYL